MTARNTGQADSAGVIAISNSGIINGGVHVRLPPKSHSGYLHQVEAIAAAKFCGREKELSELADFCTQSVEGERRGEWYWRWLAPAWAGKSALMAHFVLNPPAGVDVISFFITARLAGQSDRLAFCEVVQRQIYALLGEEEPITTPSTRDEQLRLAIDRAAEFSHTQGRRLIILVDGLDEDRGVTAGPDSYSIAALLPRTPKYGMRLILAGRPHPPIPDDVLADHPLRDPAINRWLEVSPHAQAIRHDAERDLLRLLDGGGLGRELVGLVSTAGGGLSAADLAYLTGSRTRLVERELSAVSGRSFRRRTAHWAPRDDDAPQDAKDVYLLGHEELQISALSLLTNEELTEYRHRLHSWADRYRRRSWPPEAPEYLLRGYIQLLRELNETARLVTIVGDRARHERLWRVTGSDLEALNEISAAFEKILGDSSGFSHIDINDVVRLAQGRDAIHDQTGNLPPKLLSLWAHFGDFDRAINLAYAQEAGHKRQLALTEVAKALASLGKPDLALEIGVSIARAGDNSFEIAEIAKTLISEGHLEYAVELAGLVAKPEKLLTVKLALTRSTGLSGGDKTTENFLTEFMPVAMSAPDSHERGTLLALIAGTLAAIGFPEEGAAVTEQATSLAESTVPKYRAAQSLASIARALSRVNKLTKEAEGIARKAGQTAASIEDPQERAWSLSLVNSALVKTGQYHLAVQLCNTLEDPDSLGESLAKVITELSDSGQHDLALKLLNEASPLLDRTERAITLVDLANALAKAGEPARSADCTHQALQAAEDLPDEWEIVVSVSAAWALYRAGFVDQSRDLAHEITEMARTRIDAHAQVGALCAAAKSLNGTCHENNYSALLRCAKELVSEEPSGYRKILHLCTVANVSPPAEARKLLEHAVTITEERLYVTERGEALAKIATTLADIGSVSRAVEVTEAAVELIQLSDSPHQKAWDTASAIRALCAVNDFDKAKELTSTLVESGMVSEALAEIASGLACSGQIDQAHSVAEQIQDGREKDHALRAIACALASYGDRDRVLEIAHQIDTEPVAERVLAVLAGAFAADGEFGKALRVAEEIDTASTRGEALGAVAMEVGPTEQGRRYLCEALSLTRWDSLLEAMAAVAPGSLNVVSEHVMTPGSRL